MGSEQNFEIVDGILKKYKGEVESVTIPDGITSIGETAFAYCNNLTKINIPDNVTSIGIDAFAFCNCLTEINIPDSVTNIGSGAFCNCHKLRNINISDSVTNIASYVFKGCSNLKNVEISGSATNIGECAFFGCINLTEINIPDSVTSIESHAFYNCSNLTCIELPNSVMSIGKSAFFGCRSLAEINIPDSVTSIGDYAFEECSSLVCVEIPNHVTNIGSGIFRECKRLNKINVAIDNNMYDSRDACNAIIKKENDELIAGCNNTRIPDSVKVIGKSAFSGCTSLTEINIPKGVTSIEEYAFGDSIYAYSEGCSSLTCIKLPDSVTSIGEHAFSGCSGLTEINIPDGVANIGNHTFDGCSNLAGIEIPGSVTSIGRYAFNNCQKLKKIDIPDNVTNIGEGAFYDCHELKSIYIPNSVTDIGNSVLKGCSKLKEIKVATDNTMYDSRDNCNAIIKKKSNELIAGCKSTRIPDGVTSIGESAFEECSGLICVEIPDGATSIGESAFKGCSGLKEINIPHGVTNIGNYAFEGCNSLTNVKIPNSVTSIGEWIFHECSKLTKVEIPNSVTSIGYYAFSGCSNLKRVEIPNSVTSIGDFAFRDCSSLISAKIPNGVTSIGHYTFGGCSSLTKVEIPDSITSIESCAFYGCQKLESIDIPDSVTSIGYDAFNGCTSLTRVKIPDSLIDFDETVFQDCPKLVMPKYNLKRKKELPIGFANIIRLHGRDVLKPDDWAWICLFQDSREYRELCRNYIPSDKIMEIAGIMAELPVDDKEKYIKSAAEYIQIFWRDDIGEELVRILSDGKGWMASSKYENTPFKLLGKLFDEQLLMKDYRKYGNYNFTNQVMLLSSISQEASEKMAPPLVVLSALMPYLEQYTYLNKSFDDGKEYPKYQIMRASDFAAGLLDSDSFRKFILKNALDFGKTGLGEKGAAWFLPCCRFGSNEDIHKLLSSRKHWSTGKYSSSSVMVLRGALFLSDTREAMMELDKQNLLEEYASWRGTDVNVLWNTVIADFGGLGQKTIKRVTKTWSDRTLQNFLDGKRYPAEEWRKLYMGNNAYFRQISELLVWVQDCISFAVQNEVLKDCNGKSYTLSESDIQLAHPMEMRQEEVLYWQKYFADHAISQPFTQVWEPVIPEESVRKDRYKGCEIPAANFFRGQEKHGVLTLLDPCDSSAMFFGLKDCMISYRERYSYGISGIRTGMITNLESNLILEDFSVKGSYNRRVNHIVSLLDKWTGLET